MLDESLNLNVPEREGASMPDLTSKAQRKEPAGTADFAFVAYVVIILAIAVMLTLTKIYLQGPG